VDFIIGEDNAAVLGALDDTRLEESRDIAVNRFHVASDARGTTCEFKGRADYLDVVVGDDRRRQVAWTYPEPWKGYEELAGYVCFYPGRVDAAWLGDERVTAQEGDFYGGWITRDLVGPFKGGAGTLGW